MKHRNETLEMDNSNLEKELANLRLQLDSKLEEAATLNEKLAVRNKMIRLLHSTLLEKNVHLKEK